MASRIKGITVEIGGDTTKLQTALKGVKSEIKNTQAQRQCCQRDFQCGHDGFLPGFGGDPQFRCRGQKVEAIRIGGSPLCRRRRQRHHPESAGG